MTDDMLSEDEPPVYPLLSYGTGVIEGAVALSLEVAADSQAFETREGSWVSTAMSADDAIALGRQLISLGEQAGASGKLN